MTGKGLAALAVLVPFTAFTAWVTCTRGPLGFAADALAIVLGSIGPLGYLVWRETGGQVKAG